MLSNGVNIMRRTWMLAFIFAACTACGGDVFKHEVVTEKKPWTHERFQNSPENFSFIIIPDRTGGERKGVFPEAIRKANMLFPEFILTVGDLIRGQMDRNFQDHEFLRAQWRELESFTAKSAAPFFHVVGNHDIARTRKGFPRSNETSREVWTEFRGERTYYYFIYKNVLFLCLNTMEGKDARPKQTGITKQQLIWAESVLRKYPDVRWTCVFLHQPGAIRTKPFVRLEKELQKRNYTVFAGDWHRYCKFRRYGRNYYVLATAGGVSRKRGIPYGEFDHITFVTMTDNGPVVANILLEGILDDDVVTSETIKEKWKSFRELDYPAKKQQETPESVKTDGKAESRDAEKTVEKQEK